MVYKKIWQLSILIITVSLVIQCAPLPATSLMPTPTLKSQQIDNHPGLIYYSERKKPDGLIAGGLYLLELKTKKERYLTPDMDIPEYGGFSWSPITQKLVYTGGRVEELYLMSLDNDNVRLTNNTVEDSRPIWSLDGKRIAFLSRRRDDNLLDLYIMASDGSKVQRIFDDKSTLGGGFAWAPNSQMLAISTIVLDQSSVNSNPVNELRIINVETKDLILRLSDDQLRYGFDWSYDNNKLVYASEYEIYQNMPIFKKLYTLDIHTGQETQIANFDSVSDPHWSPINNIIAFGGGTFEKGEMNIYLINSDGTNMRQLTEGGFYSLDSWSPDGKKLAIASIKNWRPDSELYILDVESGQLEQMTGNDTYEAYPLWIEF